MEYKSIVNTSVDMAGKHRVTVDVGEAEALVLKFSFEPTEKQVIEEINRILSIEDTSIQDEILDIDNTIQILTDRKAELQEEL